MFLNKNLTRWLTVALLVMFVFTLGYVPAPRQALAGGSQPIAVIDAAHTNIYTVNGSYSTSGAMMITALQAKGFNVVVNTAPLTSSVLNGAKVLIITDPGDTSLLSSAELSAVANYVYGGGNLIVTCKSDYGDPTTAYESSQQGNSVLQAVYSNMRFNSDEIQDSNSANQDGNSYTVKFPQYETTKYNLVKTSDSSLPLRLYSAASIYLQSGGTDSAIDWIAKPNSTTSGTDCNGDGRVTPPDGKLHLLGAELLAGGGKLVAAGATFFSDYELGNSSFSNSNIFNNIIDWFNGSTSNPGPVQVAGTATDATVAMDSGNTTVSNDNTWTIKISSGTVRNAVYNTDLAITGLPSGLTYTAAKVAGANSILVTVSSTATTPVTAQVNVSIVVNGSAVNESGATASNPIQVQLNPATFDIVEITDLHGTLETTSGVPVAAELAENVSDVVFANNPNQTLILSGGDNYQGTAISNLEYGKPVMQVFNAMGVAASAVGNHEFDWGLDKVTSITNSVYSNYPFICANLFYKGTNTTVFDPYKIFNLNGEKIAVVGGLTEDTPNIVLATNIAPYDLRSNVTCINAAAADARVHGAQVVLALIHEGDNYNNGASGPIVDIAKQLIGVDAVLGGHSHSIVNTTVTTNAGVAIPLEIGNAYGYGFIDLKFYLDSNGKPVFANPTTSYYPEDTGSTAFPYGYKAASPKIDGTVAQQVYQIVAQTKLEEGPILNTVLGSAAINLTRAQAVSPCGESLAGNWSTDVIRNKVNADFGFMNNGGLRIDIPQGTITYSTMLAFQPFGNTITTCNMTGAQVKTVLEEALTPQSGYPNGRGVQVSGLKFSYDMTQPVGSRILSITKSDGTPVSMTDTTTTYKVATNNFVSGGGDGFVIFKNVASTDTGIDVMKACSDAVTAAGAAGITAVTEHRIVNGNTASVDVLATSDIHGYVYPYDYFAVPMNTTKDYGLARVSTYVYQQRQLNPNLILVDNGDTIQGAPLATYYTNIAKSAPNPMIKAFAAMHYDTWTLGNHEFNFGLDYLNRVIGQATVAGIHVLSANTYKTTDGSNFVEPYIIKSVPVPGGGHINVGILGMTTKCIPNWESPDHYAGLQFNDLVTEANKWVPIIRAAGADVVVATIHSGEESASDIIPENEIKAVATKTSGIDAIVAGHTHVNIPQDTFTNAAGKTVIVTEPSNQGKYVSKLHFDLSKVSGVWTVQADSSTSVPMLNAADTKGNPAVPADPAITALDQPDEDATMAWMNTAIGTSTAPYSGADQLTKETAIMDLINKIQQQASGAQLSIAAPLSSSANIPQGNVTVGNISSVYVYENFLMSLNMTGAQLKKWLEWSVRYYKQVNSPTDPIVKDPVLNIPDYNLDQLYGANYTIDLTQPAGSRIKNLTYNGKPVQDSDLFTVAINNYRYNGGGGFMAAAGLTPGQGAIYDSSKALGDAGQVRNLMIKYVQDQGTITPVTASYWTVSAAAVANTNDTVSKVTATVNGDPASSEGFTWYTGTVSGNSDLQVVPNTGTAPDWSQATSFTGTWAAATNSPSERVHKAEATGLQANASYYYRVGDATLGVWNAVYGTGATFRTAPTSGAFTFVDLTDTQALNEPEAVISSQTIAKALSTVNNAKFLALGGDFVEYGNQEANWNWVLNHAESSLENTTLVPVAGNHESNKDAYIQHFDVSAPNGQDTTKGAYYSYNYSNAHFIVLNTNDNSTDYADFSPAQLQWMQSDVQAARAAGAKWIIAMLHKGPYTTANHATDSDIMGAAGLRAKIAPVMASLGIDLVLQGHDHIYARSKPIKADGTAAAETQITEAFNGQNINYIVNPNGSIYLIPGTAGCKVYYKNKTIDPSYFNLFDNADENHAAQYGPDNVISNGTEPKRGQVQTFEGITIDGSKLSVISYEIDQNQNNAQPYVIDTFGIEKQSGTAPAAPAITPNGGYFANTQAVGIGNIPAGDMAYYTLDGSTPTVYSYVYSSPFTLTKTTTVTAAVFDPITGLWSAPVSATFTKGAANATIRSISVLDSSYQPVTGPLTHGHQYYLDWKAYKNSDGSLPGLAIVEALDGNQQATLLNAASLQVLNSPDTDYTVLFQPTTTGSFTVKGFLWNDWSTSASWQSLASAAQSAITVN